MNKKILRTIISAVLFCAMFASSMTETLSQKQTEKNKQTPKVLTGQGALGDWTTDAPGVRRIMTADLPKPFETKSVVNALKPLPRPASAMPKMPDGFKVGRIFKRT